MLRPAKYVMRTTPDPHQTEALRRRDARPDRPSSEDVFEYAMEMGTGKSWVILADWQDYVARGKLRDILIVAPSGCYRNWFEDKAEGQEALFKAHLDPRLYKQMIIAPWVTGGGVARRRRLEQMLATKDRPRALIVNAEAVSTVREVETIMREFLSDRQAMFVIDESTVIRNGKAERTKVLMRLRDLAPVRRIATGLDTPKSPMDLFWQFYFLDYRIFGFQTLAGFRNQYAVTEKKCYLPNDVIRHRLLLSMGIRSGNSALPAPVLLRKLTTVRQHVGGNTSGLQKLTRPELVRKLIEEASTMRRDDMIECVGKLGGYVQVHEVIKEYKNLDELHRKKSPYSYRVLKKDCLNLKPKVYLPPRIVPMSKEQRRLYEEVKRNATAQLDEESHVTATTVLSQMTRLHQICVGHVVDENGEIRDVPSHRIAAILELLENHGGKAIIWSTYRREIDKIVRALSKEYGPESVAQYHGGNKRTRHEDERRFLSDARCLYMVSTQSAGGWGNTWNVADLVIYAANNFDLEQRLQSEDRPHRRGQDKSVTYVDLQCENTVETKQIHALRKKIDVATVINGENYREWII